MIYLCRNGHKHRTQDGSTNCGYCKANLRKAAEKVKKFGDVARAIKKQLGFGGDEFLR